MAKPLARMPTDQLWGKLYTLKSRRHIVQVRNLLVERYLLLVKYNAERIHAKLPNEVERDDLISAGVFGLVDAIENYNPARKVKFETYCAPRIRGAILDYLRSIDYVSRLERQRKHKYQLAVDELYAQTGRPPTDEEIRKQLKVSKKEYHWFKQACAHTRPVPLSRKWFETDSGKRIETGDLVAVNIPEPDDALSKQIMQDFIMDGLDRTERLIIILCYYEEMTMKEIGAAIGFSESRVSQIHSDIMQRLQLKVKARPKFKRELLGFLEKS